MDISKHKTECGQNERTLRLQRGSESHWNVCSSYRSNGVSEREQNVLTLLKRVSTEFKVERGCHFVMQKSHNLSQQKRATMHCRQFAGIRKRGKSPSTKKEKGGCTQSVSLVDRAKETTNLEFDIKITTHCRATHVI